MESIKLKSGEVFEISEINQPSSNVLFFRANSIADADAFKEILIAKSLKKIKVFTGKTLSGEYDGYVNVLDIQVSEPKDGLYKVSVLLGKSKSIESTAQSQQPPDVKSENSALQYLFSINRIDIIDLDILLNRNLITEDDRSNIINNK